MDDFPVKIANLLESIATRVRSMTVDRVARLAKWIAGGLVLAVIVSLASFFLLVGLFRLIGELVGVELAYGIVGGLFVALGISLWRKRKPKPPHKD